VPAGRDTLPSAATALITVLLRVPPSSSTVAHSNLVAPCVGSRRRRRALEPRPYTGNRGHADSCRRL